MPTWLITGCSTGLGRHLAEAVLEHGHQAVVTARDPGSVQDLVDQHPDTALAVALDVSDPEQVRASVRAAEERFGGVDVLVNNAGYGYRAALEEGDEAEVAQLFATNFFGAVALTKAVLPGMRSRRSGAVVNISSIGAQVCPAGSGYYAASKAALEAASSSLAKEVAPLGISVVVVEPGCSAPTSPAAPCSRPASRSATTPRPPAGGARRTTTPTAPSPATRRGPPRRSSPRWRPTSRRRCWRSGRTRCRATSTSWTPDVRCWTPGARRAWGPATPSEEHRGVDLQHGGGRRLKV